MTEHVEGNHILDPFRCMTMVAVASLTFLSFPMLPCRDARCLYVHISAWAGTGGLTVVERRFVPDLSLPNPREF